jgi:3-oxoadipate enol-lactonase
MSLTNLHVVDDGQESLLPVVFLHAFPLHSGMWAAQREALRGKARFVTFDVRGLGKSAPGRGASMLEHVVDDLLLVLDDLRIESALLCGLSMGGYVALRAVERAPTRVRGLLLCDTQSAADTDEAKLRRADGVRKVLNEGAAAYAETFMRGALSPRTLESRPDVVNTVRKLVLESTPEGIAHALGILATRTDTTKSLAHIRVPTRVLVGDADAITPPKVAHDMASAITGANVHEIHGAGHLSSLEAPDAFNALLLQHVQRVGA